MSLDGKAQIDSLVIDLTREFGHQFGEEAIRREVTGVYGRFAKAKVRQFVPVLTRRIAREHLLVAAHVAAP